MTPPILYLIRHGEKPADGGNGLSAQGVERAQALVKVFGKGSGYDIGYILAEKPSKDGTRARPSETVTPLAKSLNLTINDGIDRDDAKGVAKAVEKILRDEHKDKKEGKDDGNDRNILICWEHGQLTEIAEAIGVKDAPEYPGDRFDIIWTVEKPYDEINEISSEHVPGLDDAYSGDA